MQILQFRLIYKNILLVITDQLLKNFINLLVFCAIKIIMLFLKFNFWCDMFKLFSV